MKKGNTTKKDKTLTSPTTTDSLGTSTSANLNVGFAGPDGDDSTSYFPSFHEDKNWSSKTTSIDTDDDD